jgi:glutamate decarboxylase
VEAGPPTTIECDWVDADDVVVRLVGNKLSELWNQPVVVENRPGGSGVVAIQAVKANGSAVNFVRLGRAGYTKVMIALSNTARWFSDQLRNSQHFDVISDGSKIPVVAFKLSGDFGYTEFDVSAGLRSYGWQVPAYTMPPGAEDISVLRVVVREGFSADLARSLWEDLHAVLDHLDAIQPDGHFTQEHFAH